MHAFGSDRCMSVGSEWIGVELYQSCWKRGSVRRVFV